MSTKDAESNIIRITDAAGIPVILSTSDTSFIINDLKDTYCPAIELDSTKESDHYTVDWYLYEDGEATLITTNELAHSVVKDSFNPVNFADKIKEVSKDKDLDGAYYPIITNHLNGSTATTTAPAYENMFHISYDV